MNIYIITFCMLLFGYLSFSLYFPFSLFLVVFLSLSPPAPPHDFLSWSNIYIFTSTSNRNVKRQLAVTSWASSAFSLEMTAGGAARGSDKDRWLLALSFSSRHNAFKYKVQASVAYGEWRQGLVFRIIVLDTRIKVLFAGYELFSVSLVFDNKIKDLFFSESYCVNFLFLSPCFWGEREFNTRWTIESVLKYVLIDC